MHRAIALISILAFAMLACGVACAQAQSAPSLEVYVIDVEGGNATLFVSPGRESLLIDTGNAGAAAPRDAGRIVDAIKDAGLQQIDHLIITHWHGDHFGGLSELAGKVPIRDGHRGAMPRQTLCNRTSQAAAPARNQRHPARQIEQRSR